MYSYIYLHIPFICLSLFTFNFVLFYLDDFKLSEIKYIKYIQTFSFIFISLYMFYNLYNIYAIIDIVDCIKDDNDINIHGHISLDKEAAKQISNGLNTIGSQLGLGATITGVSLAVAKGITKSSMPPLQKAGVILSTGLIAGLGHSRISVINRNSILKENIENNNHAINNISSSINKLLDDTVSSSPLQDLLLNTELLNYTCLSLTLILMIQITFKFHLKDKIKLNLSNLLGYNINNKLEYYLNKIIVLNKKMSIIYIWIILIALIFGLSFSALNSSELYNHIDDYILVHNSLNK